MKCIFFLIGEGVIDAKLDELTDLVRSLNELKLGFAGELTMSDAMDALKAVVGDKRMEHPKGRTFKIDELNKIDEHLRHYVLANIQYAGVVITGEEPGSRQSLQGIAVTVGGLNTLANNGDKTLCPGMKLCMTVPRCVPDSTQWPAPCDHIGLPHGKVTPILRQAEAQDGNDERVRRHHVQMRCESLVPATTRPSLILNLLL